MEKILCDERPRFLRYCLSAWQSASNGVTAQTNSTQEKYWALWEKYASMVGISPYLDKTVPPIKRDLVAGAFSARVWMGDYGRGLIIRVGGVSEALAAVSKTTEMAGQPSAIYRGDNKYQLFLKRELEGFRCADPPSVPQLDVPVTVPHAAFEDGITSTDPFL